MRGKRTVWIIGMVVLILMSFQGMAAAAEKPNVFVQLGHSQSPVSDVAFSPDGRYVLTGSNDTTIKLWDAATGREIKTFSGHKDPVLSVAFSPDGRFALSGSMEEVKLWDVNTGREIRTFAGRGVGRLQNAVAYSPDGRYIWFRSEPESNALDLRDVSTGEKIRKFTGHKYPVGSVVFSSDGRYALSASYDKTIKLWDMYTGQEIRTFSGHSGSIKSISLSPDGRYALSASSDKIVKLWDVNTGQELREFRDPPGVVKGICWSPDSKAFLIASGVDAGNTSKKDYPLILRDANTGEIIRKFLGHSSAIAAVKITPDGQYAVSCASFHIKMWELATGKEIRSLAGLATQISSVNVSVDGLHAASVSAYGSTTMLWELATGKAIRRSRHGGAVSPDNKYIADRDEDGQIKLWELATGKEIVSFNSKSDSEYPVIFSPNGHRLLTRSFKSKPSDDGQRVVWSECFQRILDVQSGKEILTFRGHSTVVHAAAFSLDGNFVLSAAMDEGMMKLWDASTGQAIRQFSLPKNVLPGGFVANSYVGAMAFSRNGRYAASGGADNKDRQGSHYPVTLWNVSTGEKIKAFSGHTAFISSVDFSPDGRQIVSASSDGEMKLWDVASGQATRTLSGHKGYIQTVRFTPDGRYIVSGGLDSSTRIWDGATGKELAMMVAFPDGEWVTITPDGYFDASPNGAKNLSVLVGNNVYGIDQFYAGFYRPDMVQLALAGKELPKSKEGLTEIAGNKPAPTVEIVSPRSGTFVEKDSINLTVKLKDNGGGIGSITVYLNGSQVANEARAIAIKGTVKEAAEVKTFELSLLEGNNDIRVVATNSDGSMESSPATITLISRAVLSQPNLYALVIGIDKYKNESIALKHAVADAKAFAETLRKGAMPLFEKVQITLLTTFDETSKDGIRKTIGQMKGRIKPNDVFVFYNASHGVLDIVDDQEQYFLLTSNVLLLSSRNIGKEALSQKELAELIGNISAQKKLIILDTCHAGRGGKELTVALLQQTRGLTESTAVKLLQRAIGSAVFSASSDTQQALEGYKGHGLFTYVLNEGLNGKADVKKDGFITINALAEYVEEEVVRLSQEVFKRQQTPTIQIGVNFPVGKVK
jgi:WD40 repeat protein